MHLIQRLFQRPTQSAFSGLSFEPADLRAEVEKSIERGWSVPLPHLPLTAEQIADYNRRYPGYRPYGFPTHICELVGEELKAKYPELTWSYSSHPKGYHVFFDVRSIGVPVLPFTEAN